jgi:hypothetical protein
MMANDCSGYAASPARSCRGFCRSALVAELEYRYLGGMGIKRTLAVSLIALVVSGRPIQARPIDPFDIAGQMPGASWRSVMKKFRQLDRDDHGLVSPPDQRMEGEIGGSHANVYEFQIVLL